jgi:ABC-2 type transport system permease protein/capsular polysaccharide transport system permease protein
MQTPDSLEPSTGQRNSPWQSLRIQQRVVGALLMREVLTRYGRHNIGVLWMFVEPMIFTVGVVTLWTLAGLGHGSAIPIVAFGITGYSSVLLWRNMPGHSIGAVEPNRSLLYHSNVKVIDVYLARLLLEAVGATISFIVLSSVAIAFGWMQPPEDVLKVLGGWFMLAWFGASLTFLVAPLSEKSEVVHKLWGPMTYLLFPLSGAAFLVDALPKQFQDFLLLLPMVHGVELVRDGFFGSAFNARYDMVYMASFCAGLTVLGLAQVRDISRKGVLD